MSVGPIVGRLYDRFGTPLLLMGRSLLHVFGIMTQVSPESTAKPSSLGMSAYAGWYDERQAWG